MSAAFASWMAAMVVQVSVVVAAVAIADRLLPRRAWPQLRMGLWLLVFVKLVLPPHLASPVGVAVASDGAAAAPGAAAGAPFPVWPVTAWATGAAILVAVGVIRRVRLAARLAPVPAADAPDLLRAPLSAAARRIGLRRLPRVAFSDDVRGPAVFGVLRPVLVVAAGPFRGLAPAEREHVLLHEMAHLRRRDPVADLVLGAVGLAYWFHPLVWLAGRRVRALRELCCDATVAGVLREETAGYRRTLLRAAGASLLTPAPATGLPFLGGAGIVARLRSLEGTPWRRPALRRAVIALVLVAAGVTGLPMAPAAPTAPKAAPDEKPRILGCTAFRVWMLELMNKEGKTP